MKKSRLLGAFCAAMFSLITVSTNAATLIIDNQDQLRGALRVDVNGFLFDVEFINSSCIGAFDGCNDATNFTFQTVDDATAASQALFDQVLIDSVLGDFDSIPAMTASSSADSCSFTCGSLIK